VLLEKLFSVRTSFTRNTAIPYVVPCRLPFTPSDGSREQLGASKVAEAQPSVRLERPGEELPIPPQPEPVQPGYRPDGVPTSWKR
jgi:hypothetical protein